jgi:hypothetical protein
MTVTVLKVETLEYESDQTVFPWLKNKRVAGVSTEHSFYDVRSVFRLTL